MGSRRIVPPPYEERFIQHHPREPLPLPVFLENKLASQVAEIEELATDNHKLSSSHMALRQDLVAAQREGDNLREHIRSIQVEGDIQFRILLDKIAKMEADIRAGDKIKRELQEARIEAQSLVTARQESTAKIQKATKELENLQADVKKLPELHAELDSLRQEHQRLRKTFECEKGVNVEKVEQLKIMEKDLIGMAEEVERLRAEVSNAEKQANAPIAYNGPYMNSDNPYPPAFHGNGGYMDSYGRPHLHTVGGPVVEGMNPYASGGISVGPPVISAPVGGAVGAAAAGPAGVGNPAWGGVYDASHSWR